MSTTHDHALGTPVHHQNHDFSIPMTALIIQISSFAIFLSCLSPHLPLHIFSKMAFGGLFGGSSSSTPVTSTTVGSSSQVKDQLKAQIGQELAVANATELVNKMTENCFELCQKAPYGTSDDVSDFVE